MNAVIIEDEMPAAESLKNLIHELDSSIQIVQILQSIEDSVSWLQDNAAPDLLFADIHLADGSSFSIFDQVKVACPIIFTTAYDEYALKAFELNSIDYLLKPINKADLQRALLKYSNLTTSTTVQLDALETFIKQMEAAKKKYKSYFLVPERDKLLPIPIQNIAYIYIDLKTTKLVVNNGKSYVMSQNLDDLIEILDPKLFFRANRQYIISHQAVQDISLWFGNKLMVNLKLKTPDEIIISKARASEFKTWFSD